MCWTGSSDGGFNQNFIFWIWHFAFCVDFFKNLTILIIFVIVGIIFPCTPWIHRKSQTHHFDEPINLTVQLKLHCLIGPIWCYYTTILAYWQWCFWRTNQCGQETWRPVLILCLNILQIFEKLKSASVSSSIKWDW